MVTRALLVGINDYSHTPLLGAEYDALAMKETLEERYAHFEPRTRALVRSEDTTRQAILDGLRDLVRGARPGDRLLFHFSGHGVQLRTSDASEPDGCDEAICPIDYDVSTGANAIRDNELRAIFETVPVGVSCAWISDCCCSQDMMKSLPGGFEAPPRDTVTRSLPSPPGTGSGRVVGPLSRTVAQVHAAMIFACASNGIAEEATFGGRKAGVLTQALRTILHNEDRALPLSRVAVRAREIVSSWGYSQDPGIEGDPAIKSRPLWTF